MDQRTEHLRNNVKDFGLYPEGNGRDLNSGAEESYFRFLKVTNCGEKWTEREGEDAGGSSRCY